MCKAMRSLPDGGTCISKSDRPYQGDPVACGRCMSGDQASQGSAAIGLLEGSGTDISRSMNLVWAARMCRPL